MKKFIRYSPILIALAIIIPIFILFIFHDIYIGTDELRTTYVSKEIASRGYVYYKDPQNEIYHTNVFVKNGFMMNKNNVMYPVGFTINSLILIPWLAISPDSILVFNMFALLCFVLSFLAIFRIFYKLGVRMYLSIVGGVLFSLTNFNLAMYVSYYPDFFLILLLLICINFLIDFNIKHNKIYLYLFVVFSSFLLAYKITMYPILFTFLPLYFMFLLIKKKVTKKTVILLGIVFILSFIPFNLPQFFTNKIGPTYGDLSTGTSTSATSSSHAAPKNNSIVFKIENVGSKFFTNFLLPKEHGKYLLLHIERDGEFFSLNNIIILFGFLFCTVYLFKRNTALGILSILLFLTSFILWGNMNTYGGGGVYDLGNLRNTHIRYMLPIITIFYILGFFYLQKTIQNKLILGCLLGYIIITSSLSLTNDYPFLNYSLINKYGYFYDYYLEKQSIEKLPIPKNAIFISTVFDDYDLSYYFTNYANFKSLSTTPDEMKSVLKRFFTKNTTVYLLFPKKDSRFNPIAQKDLDNFDTYVESHYKHKVIFESDYKKLFALSKTTL